MTDLNYLDYPWYFEPNGMLYCSSITDGRGVIVDLIDSPVDFSTSPIVGKNASSYTYDPAQFKITSNNIRNIHGTAMAGLIVADHAQLKSVLDNNSSICVAGIAPGSLIKTDFNTITPENLEKTINSQSSPKTKFGMPALKTATDLERPQIMLINLSGGEISDDSFKRGRWKDVLETICENDKQVLISAAVGNEGVRLDKNSIIQHGVLPSSLGLKACKAKAIDPLLRVGATNEYAIDIEPSLYRSMRTGSNYGESYVDVLAPGSNIPILIPGDKAMLAGGTSESAAIVTATLALMISCRPFASSMELRAGLLDYSDHYPTLENKVQNGRVLNIEKAVKGFCFNMNNAYDVNNDGFVQ